ncbi:MAG TPA: Rrf2 family transcriptional regulator [bacterium]|nr:Rrf2 family transcriptional regulator [Candidatus Omnitrophota bacterium]HOJ60626.1 Rrf2 family transcriptional regulator [bacterium]HOL93142.1 Rrf2 family transcriptional regulator [bacterium]HPP01722.1 Rrf2 family transcriptional regulator [bacterium]HXK93746.1 Rrf2 family transcriptional regulator [bacterium]
MRFSKTTDYALRIMVALALSPEERLSLHTLASREQIPRKFLEHVVRSLKEANLVQSTPGPKGGYQLSLPATLITVAQIIQAIQGPLLPGDRLDPDSKPNHLKEPIKRLQMVVNDVRAFARQRLEALTLADLAEVRETGVHEMLMYYI